MIYTDGSTSYTASKSNALYFAKSNLNNCNFILKYNDSEISSAGNNFTLTVVNQHGFQYMQFAVVQLSNDYSAWYPACNIQARVRNPANNQWLPWKTIISFRPKS